MHFDDELVGCHLVYAYHRGLLPGIGEDGEIAEHDDVGIGHLVAEHVEKAFGLGHVVAGRFERSAIVPAGVFVIRDQQDAAGATHRDASSPGAGTIQLGHLAQFARPLGYRIAEMDEERRRRRGAALGSAVFFVVAPGVVGGLIPWWLTGWRMASPLPFWTALRLVGVVLLVVGVVVLVSAFVQFVVEGIGTPAPVAPTQRLVVSGLYRYVRNPIYLALLSVIVGQALVLGQPRLFAYAAAVALACVVFVAAYEEPTLRQRYGADYDAYRRAVPAWWPRLRRR